MPVLPTSIPPRVYSKTDAARMLGISVGYLHRLINAGTAQPTVPMGLSGQKVFSPDDLKRLASALGRQLDQQPGREVA